MSKVENIEFTIRDTQRQYFNDMATGANNSKTNNENVNKSELEGFVQIHENKSDGSKELISETSNLIVYRGRAMMLCRAFGKDLGYSSGGNTGPFLNMKDKFISWFAVGNGGSATANNQSPLVVNSTDYGLGGTTSSGTHGTVAGATKLITINSKTYMGFDDTYPQFQAESEITGTSDIYTPMEAYLYNNVKRDAYLISKVQVTLAAGVANGTSGSQEISECGLFLAPSDSYTDTSWQTVYNSNSRDLDLFARVTFPTITKNASRSFTITWYIFF